jgi:hypothetical protein
LIISKEVGTFTAILKFLLTNYEIARLFVTISGFHQKIASQDSFSGNLLLTASNNVFYPLSAPPLLLRELGNQNIPQATSPKLAKCVHELMIP